MYRIVSLVLLFAFVVSAPAQVGTASTPSAKGKQSAGKENHPAAKAAPLLRKEGSKTATRPVDTEVADSTIADTTDKPFLTEIVDHLPASAKVPTPPKVLGYPVGTPGKLTYVKDQHRYYRELAKTTPRVRTFTAPEKSEQGREQLLVVVSDEENVAKIARYKEITAKL